jgi:hypothetical protein
VFVRITLNVIVCQMPLKVAKQRCVHRSKTCCQTLKHFDNVFAIGGNNIVEVSLSTILQLYRGGQFYWWEETGVPGENHRHVASHWQTLSHNVVSSTLHNVFAIGGNNIVEVLESFWTMDTPFLPAFVLCTIFLIDFETVPTVDKERVVVGGNRSTWRKSPTCRKSLTNFIT